MLGLVWPIGGGCAHQSASRTEPSAVPSVDSIWWSPVLKLASVDAIPHELASPFDYPIDVTRRAQSDNVDRAVMTSCATYLALRERGYEATSETDFAAMKMTGARCQALKILTTTTSQSRGRVARFSLSREALSDLPPALGPEPTPGATTRREGATQQGLSWSAVDPFATYTGRSPDSGVVSGPDWTTKLEILARADFTGDGAVDVLLRTVSYGTEGSWREIRLRVLSRHKDKPVLVIERELPL